MKSILDRYIDRVLIYANKTEAEAGGIRDELKDHLLQKIDDLVAGGLSREEAMLEALRQHGAPKTIGYKLRGPFPWIDIRTHGTARGFIAVGPRAVGVFAFGGFALGLFAFGGFSCGLVSVGGFAMGLLLAWGGLGVGGIVTGGMALGLIAAGGLAVGILAAGNPGIGLWVPYGWHHANAIKFQSDALSYYTPANVPSFLKSLEVLLNADLSFNNLFVFIMPAFLLTLLVFNFLLYREGKRIRVEDDWLIDG